MYVTMYVQYIDTLSHFEDAFINTKYKSWKENGQTLNVYMSRLYGEFYIRQTTSTHKGKDHKKDFTI